MSKIRFEQEAIDCLQVDLESLRASNIFLVTGKKSFEVSGAQSLIEALKDRFKFTRFQEFEDNPNILDVSKGVEIFNRNKCNAILAIGGGSTIDMAKLVKFFYDKPEPYTSYFNTGIENDRIPLIAIPTTAGTGSEATHFAVVYVGLNKSSIADKFLLPNHVALISKLHISQSPYQKAVSGIDAFSQAIEAFWSVNSTEESRKYSLDALKLIIPNLPIVVKGTVDKKAYMNMALGAFYAGKAINIAKTTAPHAFSYYLTKRFNLPHGHAVGIFLPSFIAYNLFLISSEFDKREIELSRSNDLIKLLEELLPNKKMEFLHLKVEKFIENLGVVLNLKGLNITNEDIKLALTSGNEERLKNNPRKFNVEVFLEETKFI